MRSKVGIWAQRNKFWISQALQTPLPSRWNCKVLSHFLEANKNVIFLKQTRELWNFSFKVKLNIYYLKTKKISLTMLGYVKLHILDTRFRGKRVISRLRIVSFFILSNLYIATTSAPWTVFGINSDDNDPFINIIYLKIYSILQLKKICTLKQSRAMIVLVPFVCLY